jgi:hypothetical protein
MQPFETPLTIEASTARILIPLSNNWRLKRKSLTRRVLTWHGTAIIRDPIRRGIDPNIAAGDRVDHQAEVVQNRNDKIVNPAANTTAVPTVIQTVIPTVVRTVEATAIRTVRPIVIPTVDLTVVHRKRPSGVSYAINRTDL